MTKTIEAIIYESLLNTASNQPLQQLSNLSLTGFVTINNYLNTDHGKLYGNYQFTGGSYVLNLYSDFLKTQLVASASSTTLGLVTVSQQNNSGISGTVNLVQYTNNDTNIVVVCLLSVDEDLQLENLSAVPKYDPIYGFAEFHCTAFEKIKQFIIQREKSNVFDPNYVDAKNINGATGGYNLSTCLNFHTALNLASAYFAEHLILERCFQPGSEYAKRGCESEAKARDYLENVNLTWSYSQTRVEEKYTSLKARRILRA